MNTGRGKFLEDLIDRANITYFNKGIAFCERLETSVAKRGLPSKDGGRPELGITAFIAKPRLDYRGLFYGGDGFDFDAKETANEKGMPLKGIRDTQIDFFRIAKAFNLMSFLCVYSSIRDKYYRVDCRTVLIYWNTWKAKPRRRNANYIPFGSMKPIGPHEGIALDYLQGYYMPAGPRAMLDEYTLGRYLKRKR